MRNATNVGLFVESTSASNDASLEPGVSLKVMEEASTKPKAETRDSAATVQTEEEDVFDVRY